jgi:acyl-CoA synthetase (AMP-forming)/AMP-acid ligase II
MKSTMMFCPLLLSGMLERAAGLFPEATIVAVGPDGSRRSYTYGDLRGRSRQLTAALQQADIVKGDRVATLMWNTREHLEAYFGVPATGAVLHPLNLRLHPDELSYVVNHAQDRFLIVDSLLLDVFERIRSRVRFERVFVVDSGGGSLAEGTESYEEFLSNSAGEVVDAGLSEEDAAAMCYTSGTTGYPKGVLYLTLPSECISLSGLHWRRGSGWRPLLCRRILARQALVNWGTAHNTLEKDIYVLACIPIYGDRGRDSCCDPAGSQESALELRLGCPYSVLVPRCLSGVSSQKASRHDR